MFDHCPKLQKLSVDFDVWGLTEDELAQAAEIFVKFEEIVLTEGFICYSSERTRAILRAILRALPGDCSNLKMLTLHGDEKNHTAELLEAREAGVKVNTELPLEANIESTVKFRGTSRAPTSNF